MFILCDDIRNMLMFCFVLWRNAARIQNRHSPVVERLVRVIHYVYSKDIKPKNGLYHDNGGNSVQWDLIRTTWTDFVDGIRDLDFLVLMLGGEGCCLEASTKSRIGQALKRLEEKLKVAKSVSESNGFAREALKTNVLEFLWKSVFDKEAKEATQTLKVINNEILSDLFLRLWNEAN